MGGFANHVSMAQAGLPTTVAGELASMVFAKMCAHARSIGAISQSSMFDHSAILALTRMLVEASTMHAYLREDVDEDVWAFRYLTLRLHDTETRIKFIRGLGDTGDLRALRCELQDELKKHPSFSMLPSEQQKRLLSGEEAFVGGMRRAAGTGMGWDSDRFTSLYGYLSAHTHTTPMSYTRVRDHQIDYLSPSAVQLEHATLALEVAVACLRRIVLRVVDRRPEQLHLYHPELLASWREEDARNDIFGAGEAAAQ